jgi:hypothetical protein
MEVASGASERGTDETAAQPLPVHLRLPVRQPSNVVILENVVREETKGTTEAVNAKYELMERGGYIPTGYKFDPVVLNAKLPLEFFEARNALRIAQSGGAEQYAGDSYQHAVKLMNKADGYATDEHIDKKLLIAVSREAVRTAEDARAIAVKKMDDVRLANERQDSMDAQAKSVAQADEATRRKEQAESDTAKAQAATLRPSLMQPKHAMTLWMHRLQPRGAIRHGCQPGFLCNRALGSAS